MTPQSYKNDIREHVAFFLHRWAEHRSLPAPKSMLLIKTWVKMDDPEFYDEIEKEEEGISLLEKIANKYGIS